MVVSLPVGSLEDDHPQYHLAQKFSGFINSLCAMRFTKSSSRTCLWGCAPFGKVIWVWIECHCVRHLLPKGFHLLWQVSDHPASVHGSKRERVPTILCQYSNPIVLFLSHHMLLLLLLLSSCTRVVTRVNADASRAHSESVGLTAVFRMQSPESSALCRSPLHATLQQTHEGKRNRARFYLPLLLSLSHTEKRPTVIKSERHSVCCAQSHHSPVKNVCSTHPSRDRDTSVSQSPSFSFDLTASTDITTVHL